MQRIVSHDDDDDDDDNHDYLVCTVSVKAYDFAHGLVPVLC
jgi:hypothetical protein